MYKLIWMFCRIRFEKFRLGEMIFLLGNGCLYGFNIKKNICVRDERYL